MSRRLALVELLPETIQQQVRAGKIGAHVAMKFLVPVARINLEDCERMAAVFAQYHCESRQAGQLYAAWRNGSAAIRKRILDAPDLFFKTQRQAEPKAQAPAGAPELLRDLEMVVAIVNRAHRRLAGAAVTEMDVAQREAVLRQTEQARHQLGRLADRIEKERGANVEPSATDHDHGTAHKTKPHAFGVNDIAVGHPSITHLRSGLKNPVLNLGQFNRALLGNFWQAPKV